MKKSFIRKYGLVTVVVCLILSFLINLVALQGAEKGNQDISKSSTFQSNIDPNKYYWNTYPYALLISLGLGVVIIVIGSFVSVISQKTTDNKKI
jgi:hypothetical protein